MRLCIFGNERKALAGVQPIHEKGSSSTSDMQLEFVSWSWSYLESVQRFVGADPTALMSQKMDDLDSQLGLHDLEITVELHDFEGSCWWHTFSGVFTKNLEGGFALFELVSSDS